MAFFTLVQGSVFVTSATNLPASTPVQILEKGVQGPKGTAGAAGSFPIVATPVVLGVNPTAGSLVNGMLAYVLSRNLHYKYDATSVAVADGSDIIVAAGGIGRWFSTPLVPLQPGTAGFVLTNAGPGGNPTWALPPGGPPSGAAGGDLTGTYPNPTVRAITMQGTTDFLATWTGPAGTGPKGDFEIHAQDSSGVDAAGNVTIRSGTSTVVTAVAGNIDFRPGNDGVAPASGDTRFMKGADVVLMMDGSASGGVGKMMFGGTGPQSAGIGSVPSTLGAGKIRDDRTQRALPGSAQQGGDWNLTLGASSVGAPYTTAILINRELKDTAVDTDWFNSFGLVPCTTENGGDGSIDLYSRGGFAIKWPFQSDPGLNGGSLSISAQQGGVGAATLGGGINISSNSGGLASGDINLTAPIGGDGNAGTINFRRGTGINILSLTGLGATGFFQFGLTNLVPGFRQLQSTTGAGMQWEDRTQAALAGSGAAGGIHQFIIGKRDGAATPAEFRFGHETVAGGAFTNILAIRPPATISSGGSLRVQDNNNFDILYNATSVVVGSGTMTITGQANSNAAGTAGLVSISGGVSSGGAIGGTVQISTGGSGGRIDLAEGGLPGVRYQSFRFNWYSTATNVGSGQDQAGAGAGSSRQERTQASATGSGVSGGDFLFTHGKNDGAAARGSFLFGCETVVGAASATALEVRMVGATVDNGLILYKYGTTGDFTLDFFNTGAGGAVGGIVLRSQTNTAGPGGQLNVIAGNSTAGGKGGDVEITGGTATSGAFVSGAVNIHGAGHGAGTGGAVLIEAGDSTGVPGGNVQIRPGSGSVDGDVALFNGAGTVSKIRYDGADNRIEASVPYCGDPDAAAQSFRLGYLSKVAVAGSTTLTAAENANSIYIATGTPGGAFTWVIAGDVGHLVFIRNETPSTMTVLAAGGTGAGVGPVTLTATSHGLFFVVLIPSTGFPEAVRIN